jgi:hypothetical protein
MLLELRRSLTATSGFYEVLVEQLDVMFNAEGKTPDTVFHFLGTCLADILKGNCKFAPGKLEQSDRSKSALAIWSQATALMAAMPCHVSRDGTLSQRHEARATASAMWVVNGLGTENRTEPPPAIQSGADVSFADAPVPLAIKQVNSFTGSTMPSNWGTMCSSIVMEPNEIASPFRPGVAASFLYLPMMAWDLNTFSGAVFSALLTTGGRTVAPSSMELISAAKLLLIGRVIQAIITPGGYELCQEDDEYDYDEFWSEDEFVKESTALSKLILFCKSAVQSRSINPEGNFESKLEGNEAIKHFSAVSRAILPFARSLVLILRATTSAIRDRMKKGKKDTEKQTATDKHLDAALVHDELMTFEDGFLMFRELGIPLPSVIIDQSGTNIWVPLIKRWVGAAIELELHHGSRGKSLIPMFSPESINPSGKLSPVPKKPPRIHTEDEGHRPAGMSIDDDEDDEHPEQFFRVMNENAGVLDPHMADLMGDMVEDEMMDMAEEEMDIIDTGRHSAGTDAIDDSSDEESFSNALDDKQLDFACVSRSAIIPYQPSLLRLEEIGPGTRGAPLECGAASAVMRDMSHLGMIHRKNMATKCLIRLPKSFVELYSLVNKVKGRDDAAAMDVDDDGGSSETAICLLTGAVMRSGSPRRSYIRTSRPPGACTLHSRQVGSGIGIFFLVQKCTVLLMHNNKSAYSASLYVDQHGEEDPGLRRGRPLFLNEARYRALEVLWRQQGIPREVAQIRSTSDRVIRDNWY